MSDTLDNLDLPDDVKRRIIEQMRGRPGTVTPGSGAAMLPVVGQSLQGGATGVVAGALPAYGPFPLTGYINNAYRTLSGLTDLVGIGKLPGHDWAERRHQRNLDTAQKYIPDLVGEPQTPGQFIARKVGEDIGGAGPITPASTLSALPTSAKIMAGFLVPNMLGVGGTAVGTGVAAAGGLHALNEFERELKQENELPTSETNTTGLPEAGAQFTTPQITTSADTPTTTSTDTSLSPVTDTAWRDPIFGARVEYAIPVIAGLTYAVVKGAKPALEKFAAARAGETVLERRARLYGDQPDVQDFNVRADELQRMNKFTIDQSPPVGEAPLPKPVRGFGGTSTQDSITDVNTSTNRLFEHLMGRDHSVTMAVRSRLGKTNNRIMLESEIKNTAETGIDPVTGMQNVSLMNVGRKIHTLTPEEHTNANLVFHFADELNNRSRFGRAVNFGDKDTYLMRNFVNQQLQNPKIKSIVDDLNVHFDRNIDIAQARGMFTAQEANSLKTTHRNFLPSYDELTARIDNPLTARSPSTLNATRGVSADFWDLTTQHFQKFQEAIDRNETQKFVIDNLLAYQSANPRAAKIINPVTNPPTISAGETLKKAPEVIAYRDNGITRYVRVENSAIREALNGSSLRSSAIFGTFSAIQRSAMTGEINTITSLATGAPGFAPTSAWRTAGQIATNTVGYKGPADALVRRMTGERVGLPFDPTAYASTVSHAFRGAGAEAAHHIANALRRDSPTHFGQALRAMVGDTVADAVSIRAQMAWNASYRKQFIDAGLGHSAGNTSNLNSARFVDQSYRTWAEAIQDVPRVALDRYKGVEQRYSMLNSMNPELSSLMPAVQRSRILLNDIVSAVSESGHQSFLINNLRNPKFLGQIGTQRTGRDAQGIPYATRPNVPANSSLAYETANITGHPGVHGSSNAVYNVATVVPYFNIGLQGAARKMRQFRENPIGTVAAYTTFSMMAVLGEMYSAINAGPEAVRHLQNDLSNYQRTAGIRVYIPGEAPESAINVPLEQTQRPDVDAIRSMLFDLTGFTTMNPNAPDVDLTKVLTEFFRKPISTNSAASFSEALKSAAPSAELGPWESISEIFRKPPGNPPPGLPEGYNTSLGNESGIWFDKILRIVGGVSAQRGIDAIRAYKGARAFGEDGFSAAWEEAAGNNAARSSTGALFTKGIEQNARRTPLYTRVNEALANMKEASQFSTDIRNDGYTSGGANKRPLNIPHASTVPLDEGMREVYVAAGRLYNRLNRGPLSDIQQTNTIQRSLLEQGRSGIDRRLYHNSAEKSIQQRYLDIAWELNSFNDMASQRLGVPFDLRRVDWKKGPEQFK